MSDRVVVDHGQLHELGERFGGYSHSCVAFSGQVAGIGGKVTGGAGPEAAVLADAVQSFTVAWKATFSAVGECLGLIGGNVGKLSVDLSAVDAGTDAQYWIGTGGHRTAARHIRSGGSVGGGAA
jgi:hypothetical protein